MLKYTSIQDLILLEASLASDRVLSLLILYFLHYTLCLSCLVFVSYLSSRSGVVSITDLAPACRLPASRLCLLFCFFSLAGLPPLSGFFFKSLLFLGLYIRL